MLDKHLSTQFDAELSGISNRVLEMGGLVESQVAQALHALTQFSGETATQVLQQEERVNQMEVEIDPICLRSSPGASRRRATAPADRDRQTLANLERVGEKRRESHSLQRCSNRVFVRCGCRWPTQLRANCDRTVAQSLDAFARLDPRAH